MAKQPANLLMRTPVFRMSFPTFIEPRAYQDPNTGRKGDPEFNCEMLLTEEDLDKFQVRRDDDWEEINIKNAMAEVAKAEWPDLSIREAVQHGGLNWPLKDGNAKADAREAKGKKSEFYRGYKVLPIKAKADYPPQLYVQDKGKMVELTRSDESDMQRAKQLFVGGYYAKASVNLKALLTPQGKFLPIYVNAVLFVREGEKIGGMSPEERFGGIDGGVSDHDPTSGMDDEIPF